MFKKSLVMLSFLALVGCGSSNYQTYYQQAEPKYKISDEDTKKWIVEGNKRKQCVFAKQYKNKNFNNLSEIEKQLHFSVVQASSLIEVIGRNNVQIIDNDSASKNYLIAQYNKFNHSDPVLFDQKWCAQQKREYAQVLKQAKREQEKRKKEEIARKQKEEQERKAREAYLRTPAGQAELARQQQLAYQQQMLAQQRAYQQQMLEMQRQAAQQAQFQEFSNQVNSSLQGITRTMQHNTQLINEATRSMKSSCQSIGQGWGTGAWQNVCY
ncbi:DUF5358 family protein [Ursidibacter arcticus]